MCPQIKNVFDIVKKERDRQNSTITFDYRKERYCRVGSFDGKSHL